jgi:predicted ribosomally synthesized peptide with SipW-like signal peptide
LGVVTKFERIKYMNKKIIISLSVIVAAAAIIVSSTLAYLSDTETSAGNMFTAGAIDLKIDSTCHYDGMICKKNDAGAYVWVEEVSGQSSTYPELIGQPCTCSWDVAEWVDGTAIFNFDDIKPGDKGEDTISIHVDSNPAWICAEFGNIVQKDNGCNEPELKAETAAYGAGNETCNDVTPNEGELWENLKFDFWMDNGAGDGHTCNNIKDADEKYIATSTPATNLQYAIADSRNGGQPITDTCVGVEWSIPSGVNNIAQTDSVTGDFKFSAIQARHNERFVCWEEQPECGDGVMEGEEACDDGEDNGIPCTPTYNGSCDYCSTDCTIMTLTDGYCGDQVVNGPETCDGDAPKDCEDAQGYKGTQVCEGCQWSECRTYESCGDGKINDSEQCDGNVFVPPYNNGHYTCNDQCQAVYQPYCGDNKVDAGEECDDGNNTSYDGCSADCDKEAQLTVNKVMKNDGGGNNVAGDFQLYVGSKAVTSGQTYWFAPGSYVVSETGVSGYEAIFSGDCDIDGNITLAASDNLTCTLTNDDIKPNITLIKNVVGGGPLGPNQFPMYIDGSLVSNNSSKLVTSNAAHTITETQQPDYDFTSITGHAKCPANLGGTVTLNEGEAITCTITNTYNPHL